MARAVSVVYHEHVIVNVFVFVVTHITRKVNARLIGGTRHLDYSTKREIFF